MYICGMVLIKTKYGKRFSTKSAEKKAAVLEYLKEEGPKTLKEIHAMLSGRFREQSMPPFLRDMRGTLVKDGLVHMDGGRGKETLYSVTKAAVKMLNEIKS